MAGVVRLVHDGVTYSGCGINCFQPTGIPEKYEEFPMTKEEREFWEACLG